jgi:hypothetical protein
MYKCFSNETVTGCVYVPTVMNGLMNTEQRWKDRDRRERKHLEKNCPIATLCITNFTSYGLTLDRTHGCAGKASMSSLN